MSAFAMQNHEFIWKLQTIGTVADSVVHLAEIGLSEAELVHDGQWSGGD